MAVVDIVSVESWYSIDNSGMLVLDVASKDFLSSEVNLPYIDIIL